MNEQLPTVPSALTSLGVTVCRDNQNSTFLALLWWLSLHHSKKPTFSPNLCNSLKLPDYKIAQRSTTVPTQNKLVQVKCHIFFKSQSFFLKSNYPWTEIPGRFHTKEFDNKTSILKTNITQYFMYNTIINCYENGLGPKRFISKFESN